MQQEADGKWAPDLYMHFDGLRKTEYIQSSFGQVVSVVSETGPGSGQVQGMESAINAVATTGLRCLDRNGPGAFTQIGLKDEGLAMLSHDVRNMVAALALYSDLLAEPGVLAAPFQRYAVELQQVAGASSRLMEKLAVLECLQTGKMLEASARTASTPEEPPGQSRNSKHPSGSNGKHALERGERSHRSAFQPGQPILSLADELLANHNLLSALAGPGVTVGLTIKDGHQPLTMNGDDLTRVMVNLIKNAAEAMPSGGHIQIALEKSHGQLCLTVADSGRGIPQGSLQAIFASGYTTHTAVDSDESSWPTRHRGLGLAIVHSIVAAAGGETWATNRDRSRKSELASLGNGYSGCLGGGDKTQPLPDGGVDIPGTGAVIHLGFPIII